MVAVHQSVSRDVGPECVPPGVSTMWGLRHRASLPKNWREREDSMKLVAGFCVAVLLLPNASIAQTSPRGRGATPAPPAKPATPPAPPAAGKKSAGAGPVIVVETMKGTFEFETYPNEAPKTVEHIVGLVKNRFYNGQRFHRVEPGFVVQFGDPQSRDPNKRDDWGTGGSGNPIGVLEVSKKR